MNRHNSYRDAASLKIAQALSSAEAKAMAQERQAAQLREEEAEDIADNIRNDTFEIRPRYNDEGYHDYGYLAGDGRFVAICVVCRLNRPASTTDHSSLTCATCSEPTTLGEVLKRGENRRSSILEAQSPIISTALTEETK